MSSNEGSDVDRACLSMINAPPNHEIVRGRCFELYGTQVMIGRSADNEICLRDQSMGRRHARFERHDRVWWVLDMKSANGVFVNGVRVSRVRLQSGDRIDLGERSMVFLSGDIEELHAALVAKLDVRDPATGLYDYGFFFQRLERLTRSSREELGFGCEAVLAIDRHDELRSQHGEPRLLQIERSLADLFATHFGPSRLVACLDRNFFAVLFPEDPFHQAQQSCEALRDAMANGDSQLRDLTISVGLTNIVEGDQKDGGRSAHSRALQGLLSSKGNRDRVCVVPIFLLPPMPHERH